MGIIGNIKGWGAEYTLAQKTVLFLVALFPFVSVAVKDGGSTVYTLIALSALFYAWPEWKLVSQEEKLWLLAYVALFVIAALSLTYTTELDVGIKKLDRFFRLATLGLIFLFLRRMKVETGVLFLTSVVLASIYLGIEGWYEVYVLNQHNAIGIYHKIIFGDMAVLNASIILAALLTIASKSRFAFLMIAALLAALYASLMSMTRGSWLFLIILMPVMAWLFRHKVSKRGWIAVTAVGFLVFGVILFWQPQALFGPIKLGITEVQRFLQDPGDGGSWSSRLAMWQNSVHIWSDNPILGTGIGDFQHDSKELLQQGISVNQYATLFSHAHSIYFDILASLGLVGLALLVFALFVLPWRYFSRHLSAKGRPLEQFYALAGLFTLVAFAVFGLSEGWLSRNPFVNTYIMYIAVFAAALSNLKVKPTNSTSHPEFK